MEEALDLSSDRLLNNNNNPSTQHHVTALQYRQTEAAGNNRTMSPPPWLCQRVVSLTATDVSEAPAASIICVDTDCVNIHPPNDDKRNVTPQTQLT